MKRFRLRRGINAFIFASVVPSLSLERWSSSEVERFGNAEGTQMEVTIVLKVSRKLS